MRERKKKKEGDRQDRRAQETDRWTEEHTEKESYMSEEVHTAITNEEEPQFNSNRITLISDRSD